MNVTFLVFDEPHPSGAVPEPSVKVRVRDERVCVGSATVTFQDDMRMMILEFPFAFTVIGAAPFTDGIVTDPPVASQYTSMAVWWATSTRAEMEPSFRTLTRSAVEDFVWNCEWVVAGNTLYPMAALRSS